MATVILLDTNVYNHIIDGHIDEAVVKSLHTGRNARKLSIPVSTVVLGELLQALRSNVRRGMKLLRVYSGLADWQNWLKPSFELLKDDVTTFAQRGEPSDSCFMDGRPTNMSLVRELQRPKEEDVKSLRRVERDLWQQRERDHRWWSEFIEDLRTGLEQRLPDKKKWRRWTFQRFRTHLVEPCAERLSDRYGELERCKERGIPQMLEIRSVGMAVHAPLSLVHHQAFHGKKPEPSDARDMRLSTSAVGARYFVTKDGTLTHVLSQFAIEDFDVLDPTGLLERLA
jgi:hypothetical protein